MIGKRALNYNNNYNNDNDPSLGSHTISQLVISLVFILCILLISCKVSVVS